MKKNFLTGLLLLLPFTLTLVIVVWAIKFLTSPFEGGVAAILDYYNVFNKPILFFSGEQVLYFSSIILVLILLGAFLILVGILGQLVLLNTLFIFGDYIITHIPFVNKIYKIIQDIVKTLFDKKGNTFSQVVMVPFPHSKALSLALMAQDQKEAVSRDGMASVFVLGAPNPTFGFMVTCKREDIIFLDMKVDEALKFIVSCGIMTPLPPITPGKTPHEPRQNP